MRVGAGLDGQHDGGLNAIRCLCPCPLPPIMARPLPGPSLIRGDHDALASHIQPKGQPMKGAPFASLLVSGLFMASPPRLGADEPAAPLAEAKKDADGFLCHAVAAKDQGTMTQIM